MSLADSRTPTVSIVCRWFQPKAGLPGPDGKPKAFNTQDFKMRLADPLARFMRSAGSEVSSIIIVSNGDTRYGLGEFIDSNGDTPTTMAIKNAFPNEIRNGFIRTVIDQEWGNNAGSAHALNVGYRHAMLHDQPGHILSWNPELQMTGGVLARMLSHLESHGLDLVGAYRKRYWNLYQWQMPQNTACLYPVSILESVGGFDSRCDGNDRSVIEVSGLGNVTLAGMDDFDLILRLAKLKHEMPRWGMVGRADPLIWDVDFEPNSERSEMLQKKIARQPIVIERWARHHFPEIPYPALMDAFFSHRHED